MFARLFGHINSSTNFLAGAFTVLLCSISFFLFKNERYIYHTAWADVYFIKWVGYLIFTLLVALTAFSLQWLMQYHHHLLKRHAYLLFFLPIIVLGISTGRGLNLVTNILFLTFIFGGWLSVYQGEKIPSRVLNTGLLIGMAAFTDLRFIGLLPFSVLAYTVFGRISFRVVAILIIGFLTVWINLLAIEFIFFDTTVLWDYFLKAFQFEKPFGQLAFNWLQIGMLGVLVVFGLYEVPKTLSHASVFKRQSFVITLLMLAYAILTAVIFPYAELQLVLFAFAGLFLFINFFQYSKKLWVREGLMWLVLSLWIAAEWYKL